MFGGTGFYLDGVFFGLEAEGRLFFKVDDTTRPEYVARGCEPFRPFAEKTSFSYFEVPDRVLARRDTLKAWGAKAVAAARAKARPPKTARTRKIRNIGPVSSRWLAEVEVRSLEDLEAIGSVAAFRAVQKKRGKVSLNLLYALEAGLMDLRWDRLPEAVKASLRQRVGLG
jgi:DNA transformation protein